MTFLLAALTTPDEARAYLAALVANGCDYHIDDSAGDIVGPDGLPLFTPSEAALADARAAECARLLDDPCGVLLALLDPLAEE